MNGSLVDQYPLDILLGKNKEELEQILPDGYYQISTGEHSEAERIFVIGTGKGGYIEYILALQKKIEEIFTSKPIKDKMEKDFKNLLIFGTTHPYQDWDENSREIL